MFQIYFYLRLKLRDCVNGMNKKMKKLPVIDDEHLQSIKKDIEDIGLFTVEETDEGLKIRMDDKK